MNVLPAATTRSLVTIFHHLIGNLLYLGTMFADYETELVGFSVQCSRKKPFAFVTWCWTYGRQGG